MKSLLDKLKKVHTEGCVSILLNTHRTSPESQQDVIQLKNLLREAESKLAKAYDSEFAQSIADKLEELTSELNHLYNLDSMAVFVNGEIAEVVRMAIPVRDRVEVGTNFVVRDLIRAANESARYYVLVLSRKQARMIEAYNANPVRESFDGFPMINEVIETDTHKLTMATGTDNIIENFFRHVDNEVSRVLNRDRLPLVVATEERNYHHYMKVATHTKDVVAHLNQNRDEVEARLIVADCWPLVHQKVLERNTNRVEDLRKAVSSGNFMSDLNDISRALLEGRGRTLYVKADYYQPGVMKEDRIELLNSIEETNGDALIDDIVDRLVFRSIDFGGDVVFVDGDQLENFEGVALVTRY